MVYVEVITKKENKWNVYADRWSFLHRLVILGHMLKWLSMCPI